MKEKWNQEKLKNIGLIALCIVLAVGVFLYNFLGKADGEGEEGQIQPEGDGGEITFTLHEEHEGISQKRAYWLLSCLGGEQKTEEESEDDLTCGEFRDLLYAFCVQKALDYEQMVGKLPERLFTVQESDAIYLAEFLGIYEELLSACIKQQEESGEEGGKMPQYRDFYVLLLEDGKLYDEKGKTYQYERCEDYSGIFAEVTEQYSLKDSVAENAAKQKGQRTMLDYKDRTVRALCFGGEILYIKEVLAQTVTVPNVWVTTAAQSKLSVFLHGYSTEYETVLPLAQGFENTVCDLELENGKVAGITVKKDVVQGKVLLTSEKEIELEGYGRLPLSEDFRIYKIYGDLAMEKTNRILVGYSITDFVVEDGKICAALIKEKIKADTIRVLINTSGYESYYHDSVSLTADREFTVTRGGKTRTYGAGEEFRVVFEDEKKSTDRICIETVGGEGKITLLSVQRTCGKPAYRGSMEIVAAKDGLIVVNELSMEEYLYAVIPSEMPTSYGDEALKVQAVCARSYAFNQLMASRFRAYGAHVDDSVSCQVYNNVAENDASILAVKETYGLVAAHGGSVITAYYFSTSCGHTASCTEVWEGSGAVSYLTGYLQNEEKEEVDFSEEEAFREFILKDTIQTYDRDFSWYRWSVELPYEQLEKQMKKATGLDTVTKVSVTQRGKSGIALEVSVTGNKKENGKTTEQTVPIRYQTAIRTAFAPKETALVRKDGSEVKNMSLLPSAFVVMDEVRENGELKALRLVGGGYGHGTGMSQNGVKKMVETGKNYEEIIAHYYTGTELIFLY